MATLKLAAPNEKALKVLRAATPSKVGHHPSADFPHEHPLGKSHKEYKRTGELAKGWKIRRQGAQKAVSILNLVPYAIYVEAGWITLSDLYIPGHFMLKRSLPKLREIFIRDNRKNFHIFLKNRPISSGRMRVDKSEYETEEFAPEEFEMDMFE